MWIRLTTDESEISVRADAVIAYSHFNSYDGKSIVRVAGLPHALHVNETCDEIRALLGVKL